MNCPFCSAALPAEALSCPACHAFQSVQRTPFGVLCGWLGALSAILTAMMLSFVPFLLFAGSGLHGFPWILPIIGTLMAAGFLGYSRSTRHRVWLAHSSGTPIR